MKRNIITFLIFVMLFTLAYSIVRYNVFNNVPWSDLPLYIINKAISFSAIIYVAAYIILEKKDHHEISIKIRKLATAFIYIHLTISLVLLTPSYYQKFFDGTKLNLTGQVSLLGGILALGLLNSVRFTKKLNIKESLSFFKKYGAEILLLLIAVHLFVMGFKGWISPGNWPGGMPPISMLSFIAAVSPFFIRKNEERN